MIQLYWILIVIIYYLVEKQRIFVFIVFSKFNFCFLSPSWNMRMISLLINLYFGFIIVLHLKCLAIHSINITFFCLPVNLLLGVRLFKPKGIMYYFWQVESFEPLSTSESIRKEKLMISYWSDCSRILKSVLQKLSSNLIT